MLQKAYNSDMIEAGLDEAGRGCLAGSVFAAAVILPEGFNDPDLDDSKKLTSKKRFQLRDMIIKESIAYCVRDVSEKTIDEINILKSSIKAMHLAVEGLNVSPEFLIVDGNRFYPFKNIPHRCFVKGDGKYMSIAAASILAKTFRDEYMNRIHEEFPDYKWNHNKGYATTGHIEAIRKYGLTPYHRKSFHLKSDQLKLNF